MRKWIVVVVAAGGLGCTQSGDTGDDGHGIVELRIALADGASWEVLEPTARVEAPLDYSDCLTRFYGRRADFTREGTRGVEIFASWEDRLCDLDEPGAAPCDVMELDQDLGVPWMSVDYAVEGVLENSWFAFGPVPKSDLAECDAVMTVPGMRQLIGYDADGEVLWDTKSFQPAEAESGQGQAIQFNVGEP